MPQKKKGVDRREFLRAGARNIVIVGGLGALGAAAGIISHRAGKRRQKAALKNSIEGKFPELKNAERWADLCLACGWKPQSLPAAKMELIEAVSKRTGISIVRVAYTLAENPDLNVTVWRNRLSVLEKGRWSEEDINQARRVISVLNAFSNLNSSLVNALGSELKDPRIKRELKALAASEK